MSSSLWRSHVRSKGWQATAAWQQQHRCYGLLARRVMSLTLLATRGAVPLCSSPFHLPVCHTVRSNTSIASPPASARVSPLQELTRLRDLIQKLNTTNRPDEKKMILGNYRDLERLLVYMSDPSVRFNLTSSSFEKYLEKPDSDLELSNEELALIDGINLVDMLDMLSQRHVTGSRAKSLLAEYLRREGVDTKVQAYTTELDVLTVFMRLLDRNLKAGIMSKTIRDAFDMADDMEWYKQVNIEAHNTKTVPKTKNSFERSLDRNNEPAWGVANGPEKSNKFDVKRAIRSLSSSDTFPVALGKAHDTGDIGSLFQETSKWRSPPNPSGSPSWFMSRKLDGIRCILEVTVACNEYGRALKTISVRALTRKNNEIHTVAKLTDGVSKWACESSVIGKLLKSELGKKHQLSEDNPRHARVFLDGELCVLVPDASSAGASTPPSSAEESDDNKRYVEDFQEISKQWKRKGHTIETPAYFAFDVLSYDEFTRWQDTSRGHAVLAERLERVAGLVEEFQHLQREQEKSEGREAMPLIVRRLQQTRVSNVKEVDEEFARSSLEKWEGLILRRDCQYEGKRSNAIRKLKVMLDDEYVVNDIEVTTMRLAVDKEFAERRALASVLINHKGTVVNVGSGFTAEQRIRYAENPELIIGKEITVAYFEESRSDKRAGEGEYSLRFPIVKAIYENGKRDN